MSEILSLEEIKRRYPNQWVLIAYVEPDDELEVVSGEVIAHAPSRDEIYRKLLKVEAKRIAIEFTGEPPEDLGYIL